MTRNAPRDLYDLWYLTEKLGRRASPNLIDSKLSFYKMRFSKNDLSVAVQPLGEFRSEFFKFPVADLSILSPFG